MASKNHNKARNFFKRNILQKNYNSLFLFYFIVCFLIMSSCKNSSKKDNANEASMLQPNNQVEVFRETIDIPIAISLSHTEDDEMKQLIDAEYEITHETDNDIYIDINSSYYKQYIFGTRFKADQLAFFENSENVEYLTMCLDVVNNTDEKLSIKELDVKIVESNPDTIPLIYICTTKGYSNCIYFVNESWFNWDGFTFSYSIMKKGESFNGEYKKQRHISYFEDYTIIDLLPEMKEMGYDFDGLANSIRNKNIKHNIEHNTDWDVEPITHDENFKYLSFNITDSDDDFDYFQEKFKPFELKKYNFDEYEGMAILYGSLKFDNTNFKADFIAEISLSTPGGFGALSYENDKFDIKLKSLGKDYTLRYPYTTIIEPYGAEMIKLSVTADKSSSHSFYIDIKNDNDLKIRSKNIYFHHYLPKN